MNTVSFQAAPSPPPRGSEVLAVSPEGLLPLLLWRNVPVVREVSTRLNVVEQFFLKAALVFGRFSPRHMEEVISVPRPVVHRIALRMQRQGAVVVREDNTAGVVQPVYEVVPEVAGQLQTRCALIEQQEEKHTFLYLPETDDLVFLDGKKGTVGMKPFGQMAAALTYPIAQDEELEGKHAFLARRVAERSVVNLPANITKLHVPAQDKRLPDKCPAFRYRNGQLVEEEDHWRLSVVLHGPNRKKPSAAEIQFPLDLGAVTGLADFWLEMLDLRKDDRQRQAWKSLLPEVPLFSAVNWRRSLGWCFQVGREAAEAAGAERNLHEPLGLLIDTEEAVLETSVTLEAGPDATALFLRDDIVRRFLSLETPGSEADLERLVREANDAAPPAALTVEAIKQRLWDLRHYLPLYRFRAARDFPYARQDSMQPHEDFSHA